jgi:hypothetical protein
MGWTKRQFVLQAFRKAGLAAVVFDLEPDQLQSAMVDMDAMVGTWYAKGIRIGYPLPQSPQNADLDQATGVPGEANEAIYLNLSIRIAPDFGKIIAPEVKIAAKLAYDVLIAKAAMPGKQQMPSAMPQGAGNKAWERNEVFVTPPDLSPFGVSNSGNLTFLEE